MKRLKISFLIFAIAFAYNSAFGNSGGGGNDSGVGGQQGNCVNNNCSSKCDNGNTIWGGAGTVKVCVWNSDKKGWGEDVSMPCPDNRVSTLDSTIHKWVRGGEDVSRRRCWNAVCIDDGTYFPGNLSTKAVDTTKCLPCDAALKKMEVGAATSTDDGNSQLTFRIVNR